MPDTVVPEELYSLVYHFLKDTDHPRTAAAFKNECKKPFHEIADLNYDLIKIFNDFKSEKTRRDVNGKDDTSSEESSPDSFSESISNDETLSQRTVQNDTSKLRNNDTTSDDNTSSNDESDQDSSDDTSSSTKDHEKQNNGDHDFHHSESEDEKLSEEIVQKSSSVIENGEKIENNENSGVQEISENNRTNGNNLKRRNDDLDDHLKSMEQEHEYTFSPKKLNNSQKSEFFTRNSKNTNKFTRDSTNGHNGNKPNGFLKSTIGSYGQKAQKDFTGVRGKDFRAQKTKKKRGSYRGGKIDLVSHSIKFDELDQI
ncbi:18694_t:CDS:2 [Acaulospora morrowiae]|uniref:18694_t:CDS:1 n=1 Tax=Acaulospora morrowiae TaxID=94023 RepID=A0A9N9E1H7_9GLOM|nr:18694_t:CDS:2 [Acaulospora morrowiae]